MPQTSFENLDASLSMLITSLASSAIVAMGLAPDPQSGKTETDRGLARFNIDLLTVLQSKTRGNLTPEESQFLEAVLADLQLKFVNSK